MSKRTIQSFFSPPSKRVKSSSDIVTITTSISPPPAPKSRQIEDNTHAAINRSTPSHTNGTTNYHPSIPDSKPEPKTYTHHPTYPFPIQDLPPSLSESLESLLITALSTGKPITTHPHLDLLYFQPLIPQPLANRLFKFLRSTLPFYRVSYNISRFGKETTINTPRFTTVFGLDDTSRFDTVSSTTSPMIHDPITHIPIAEDEQSATTVTNTTTRLLNSPSTSTSSDSTKPSTPIPPKKYKSTTQYPRPIPPPLQLLLNLTTALTGSTFNFCLVNYYANGIDSISYHSDDERFLGTNPAIASFTLGATRDFCMRHKKIIPPLPTSAPGNANNGTTKPGNNGGQGEGEVLKFNLSSGDMLLMRGETQANWLHSIPKRKGKDADKGRINITLRRAMVPGGTENYYRYNVGEGEVFRWDEQKGDMVVWSKEKQ